MTQVYRTLRVAPSGEGVLGVVIDAHRVVPADAVRSAKRVLNELTLPGPDAIRADARRFHQSPPRVALKFRWSTSISTGPRGRPIPTSSTAMTRRRRYRC